MHEEINRTIRSPQLCISFLICLLTFMGYSVPYWIGCNSIGEWMEYRESALQLSIGGIFFGGFMLLLPFCAALAHSTSQIDDMNYIIMQWEVLRGSISKYVRNKVCSSMFAAAISTSSAFIIHAILWNLIALPVDPATYPNHTIYFSKECIFYNWYTICYGLPVYIEIAIGIAFTASVWSVVALAISIWIHDKLLTITIPSFLYYLWNADVVFFFTGIKTPHPAILFNDGLTIQKAFISIISYSVVLTFSLIIYVAGCQRRCRNG